MYDYGTTGKSLVSVFNRFIPLYISAIAVAVGFKMGLFNIGVEGQYLLSALSLLLSVRRSASQDQYIFY